MAPLLVTSSFSICPRPFRLEAKNICHSCWLRDQLRQQCSESMPGELMLVPPSSSLSSYRRGVLTAQNWSHKRTVQNTTEVHIHLNGLRSCYFWVPGSQPSLLFWLRHEDTIVNYQTSAVSLYGVRRALWEVLREAVLLWTMLLTVFHHCVRSRVTSESSHVTI